MQNLLKIPSNIFDIVTILNQSTKDDGDLFYFGKLRDALMEYISFEEIEEAKGDLCREFIQKIPLIQTSFKGEGPYFFKISLLCKRIGNPAKFFMK